MAGKIFINYRKSLSLAEAQLLHGFLEKRFGEKRVYLDVHGLTPGSDWFHELERQVQGSAVMLVLIPPGWEDVVDETSPDRPRRLEKADDFVRFEIMTALQRKIDLIPVLMNREALPDEQALPRPLRRLHDAQAAHFRSQSYRQDAEELIKAVQAKLKPGKRRWPMVAATALVALGAGAALGPYAYRAADLAPPGLAPADRSAATAALRAQLGREEKARGAAEAKLTDAAAARDAARKEVARLGAALRAVQADLEKARDAAKAGAGAAGARIKALEARREALAGALKEASAAQKSAASALEAAEAKLKAADEKLKAAEAQLARVRAVAPVELFAAPPSDAAARIRAAQTALKALGYDIGEVDGVAGAKTEAALTAFQKAAHIDASGAADQATLDALALAVRYRAALKPIAPPISSFKDLESFTECAACPEMVAIPAGSFLMGSPKTELKRDEDEGPQRRVAIKRFAIGKYEITFEQWDRCAAEGYCRSNPKPKDMGWGRGKRPVTNVSWDDITGAGGFLDWLNSKVPGSPYRLPSEAEWEYAARAGTRGPFSFTDKISADKANYDAEISYDGSPTGVYRRKTLAVGSFKPNPWGLYDVHGNVWEWVQDCWHGSYKGAPTDGSAWMAASGGNCSYAVLRGGSWYNNPYWLRSARRFSYPRSVRYGLIGFRVARTIIPS